jgi:DNA recombination protein RmuC
MDGVALLVGGVVGGLLFGLAVGWLAGRSRNARDVAASSVRAAELSTRLEERSEQIARLQRDVDEKQREIERQQAEVSRLRETQARLATEIEAERNAATEKLNLLQEAEKKLREAFQALSAEALRNNSQSFLDLAKAALGEFQHSASADLEKRQKAVDDLVSPIRESLQQVGEKLQQVEKDRIGAYSSLSEQVRSLALSQQQLQAETANLVKALRTPNVRGRWGEIQLKRVVELAGMLEHCDFYEQQTANTEDGRLRPDMIVRLPGGKNVVVDAKAPLWAYLEAFEASEESHREGQLKEHARQVRDHMTKLGARGYWDQFDPNPEFVVMFLPGETFFSAALQYDPSLIEFGVAQRVIPASPTTLIALLRAVAYGWRQEQIARNAQQISDLGKDLYNRTRTLATYFEDLRRGLDAAVTAYNKTVGSFESRLLVAARRFKDLGVSAPEDIASPEVIDRKTRRPQTAELSLFPPEDSSESEPTVAEPDD